MLYTIRSPAFISAVFQLYLSRWAGGALLNTKEWRQRRWLHPYELSDTNKVLEVDASEVMDKVDGYGWYGCEAFRGLPSEWQADFHNRGEENTGGLAPWDCRQPGVHSSSFLFKEHQEPAQVQQLLIYYNAFEYLTFGWLFYAKVPEFLFDIKFSSLNFFELLSVLWISFSFLKFLLVL